MDSHSENSLHPPPRIEHISALVGNQDNQAALLMLLKPNSYSSVSAAKKEKNKLQLLQENWDWQTVRDFIRGIWYKKKGDGFIDECKKELEQLSDLAKENDLDIASKFRPNEISQKEELLSRSKAPISQAVLEEHSRNARTALIRRRYNQKRNDLIEALFVELYPFIIPTLSHRKEIDWIIGHRPFDQKVSSIPLGYFKEVRNKYGEDTDVAEYIKSHPQEIARWLYENQDQVRFGSEDRLLMINLGFEENYENIKASVEGIDFENILEIDFKYDADGKGKKDYSANAIVGIIDSRN